MIPVCINDDPPLFPCPPGSGQEVGGKDGWKDDWTRFPLIFRHFPLVFSQKMWYNKTVIPRILHQQYRERDESMSNTKTRRNIVLAIILAVTAFTGCGTPEQICTDSGIQPEEGK